MREGSINFKKFASKVNEEEKLNTTSKKKKRNSVKREIVYQSQGVAQPKEGTQFLAPIN